MLPMKSNMSRNMSLYESDVQKFSTNWNKLSLNGKQITARTLKLTDCTCSVDTASSFLSLLQSESNKLK